MQNTLKSKPHLLKESFYAISVLESGKKVGSTIKNWFITFFS